MVADIFHLQGSLLDRKNTVKRASFTGCAVMVVQFNAFICSSILYTYFLVHPGLRGLSGVYATCHWVTAGCNLDKWPLYCSLKERQTNIRLFALAPTDSGGLLIHLVLVFETMSHLSLFQVCIILGIITITTTTRVFHFISQKNIKTNVSNRELH